MWKLNLKYLLSLCSLILPAWLLCAQQSEKQYLSGRGSDHTVDWQFYCTAGQKTK